MILGVDLMMIGRSFIKIFQYIQFALARQLRKVYLLNISII